jgi:hypothetical protein
VAVREVPEQLRKLIAPQQKRLQLADAQLALARGYGFPSWTKLKACVEELVNEQAGETARAGHRSIRKQFVEGLASDLTSWARQADTRALGARFAIMPLRDILDVRAHLVESGDSRIVVDGLLEGLSHSLSRVRFNCTNALDHMADERCAEPLRRLLSDAVPRVRRAALHSLSCDACKLRPIEADEDVLPIVLDMALHDPSIRVRRAAVPLLESYCEDARAVETLRLLAQTSNDASMRRSAQGALRRRGGSNEVA